MERKDIRRITKSLVASVPKPDGDLVLHLIQQGITNTKPLQIRPDGEITLKRRREIVSGYRELLEAMDATHFMTFMPGRDVRPETIAKNINGFFCRLERNVLGRYWYKFTEDRIVAIGFLEKPDITPHYHVIAAIPRASRPVLKEHGTEIWQNLVPAGKLDVQVIRGAARNYATKDLHHHWAAESVVIYRPISR